MRHPRTKDDETPVLSVGTKCYWVQGAAAPSKSLSLDPLPLGHPARGCLGVPVHVLHPPDLPSLVQE